MPRTRPKKIITWRYDDGAGTTMEIPVYQVTKHDGIWLRVEIPALDIREECSDINLLRERVFDRDQEPAGHQVGAVSPDQRHEYCLESRRLRRGDAHQPDTESRDPRPGSPDRDRDAARRLAVLPPAGTRLADPGGARRRGRRSRRRPAAGHQSRVPDTRENRQALVELGRAFVRLGRRLCDRLHPEQVEAAVAQLLRRRRSPACRHRRHLQKPARRKESRRVRSEETADRGDGPRLHRSHGACCPFCNSA